MRDKGYVLLIPTSLQGAKKDGKSPDGRKYSECATSEEIKKLLA